jgi:hypothetical protein
VIQAARAGIVAASGSHGHSSHSITLDSLRQFPVSNPRGGALDLDLHSECANEMRQSRALVLLNVMAFRHA